MVITRENLSDEARDTVSIEALIREARRRARRRRLALMVAVLALAIGPTLALMGARSPGSSHPPLASHPSAKALAASQPRQSRGTYPTTLVMTRGLYSSSFVTRLRRGTHLTVAQVQAVTAVSRRGPVEWGAIRTFGGPEYPVRSLDKGATWEVGGPALASDWAGGSLYYVDRSGVLSATVAALSSEAVLDLTLDGGRHWLQYLQPSDTWTYRLFSWRGQLRLRVGPASFATIPPAHSYAIYSFDPSRHRWWRVHESL